MNLSFRQIADPMHQFEVKKLIEIGPIGGLDLSFTNASFYMLLGMRARAPALPF